MKKVFIDGAVGTTGLKIFDRLKKRKDIELITLDEKLRKDPSARRQALTVPQTVGLTVFPNSQGKKKKSKNQKELPTRAVMQAELFRC